MLFNHFQRPRRGVWSAVLAGWAGLTLVSPIHAIEPPARRTLGAGTAADAEPREAAQPRARLNYLSSSWESVLQNLATDTGSTLVSYEVPKGRFTRSDYRQHTRDEAVQILNQELEPLGYRLMAKGKFLTIIPLEHARTEYARRTTGSDSRLTEGPTDDRSNPTNRLSGEATVRVGRPIGDSVGSGVRTAGYELDEYQLAPGQRRAGSHTSPEIQFESTSIGRVLQTSGTTEDDYSNGSQGSPVGRPVGGPMSGSVGETTGATPLFTPSAENRRVERKVSESIAVRTRTATEIGRDIFNAFKSRSQLIDRGPNGLPAFETRRPVEEILAEVAQGPAAAVGEVWFTLELDTEQNTVYLTGGEQTVNSLAALVRRLDSISPNGQKMKLVSGTSALPPIGRQLSPQLGRLKTSSPDARSQFLEGSGHGDQFRDPRLALQGDGVESAPQIGNVGDGTEPRGRNELPMQGLPPTITPALVGGLKGDVTIESIDDLNMLILRGNERDVEQVMQVIQAIENVAQGSLPEVHLLNLRHVSSEALAVLLSDVYQRLNTQQEDRGRTPPTINVVPVVQPNAVLILAPATAIESILSLAEALDQPSDPAAEVQVLRLKHAIAAQVVQLLDQFYQDRPGLGTRVRAIADARTNSVIVQARPRELSEIELLVKRVDRDTAGATHQARVFPLTHAAADELATFLNTAIQSVVNPASTTGLGGTGGGGGGTSTQQLRDSKSVVLEFLSTSGDVQKLVRSGLLTDIRITADPRTNALLVTAPAGSLTLLGELIRVLDQPSAAVADIKMFQLKNADAGAAVTMLETLFADQDQQQRLGIQLVGAEDSSSLVPLKFQSDGRTNTVIAIGGPDALRVVEAILLKLDASNVRNRSSIVMKLRNSPAADVANAINQFLQSQRDLAQLDPDRVSTFEQLEQEIIVTAEPITNSLMISATPKYETKIRELAEQLDREPEQVIIQAMLVEVELNDTDEFGVELGFQDSVLFDRSVIDAIQTLSQTTTAPNGVQTTSQQVISQSSQPGFAFNGSLLGNNTAINPSAVGTQGLANFGVGRVNGDLGFGGLVLSASSDSVSMLIRALSSRRNVRVLSRPQILALDNQEARIQVGQKVPIVNGVNTTATGIANPNVIQQDTGIILTVTPRISPEGQVVMVVDAQKSGVSAAGIPIFTDTAGNVFNSPIIDLTIATTTVKVPDQQTIVVGGMITKSDETTERKVPYLGDIPILKNLFRFDSHTERRTELLIFLTPRIIRHDGDIELVKQVEAERMHFFEQEAEEIHGPLFSVRRPQGYDDTFTPGANGPTMMQNDPFYDTPNYQFGPGSPPPPPTAPGLQRVGPNAR
ncbi:MAG: secretin N-terminal domain-containing protein [Planctomycetaceae bacterium]